MTELSGLKEKVLVKKEWLKEGIESIRGDITALVVRFLDLLKQANEQCRKYAVQLLVLAFGAAQQLLQGDANYAGEVLTYWEENATEIQKCVIVGKKSIEAAAPVATLEAAPTEDTNNTLVVEEVVDKTSPSPAPPVAASHGARLHRLGLF